MNTFEFRAWDKDGKKIINDIQKDPVCNLGWYTSLSCFCVMQFTGLKDKNGRKIFSGDILSAYGKNWKVIFSEGCFIASGPGRYRALRLMQGHGTAYCEIIGNIYENPGILCLR